MFAQKTKITILGLAISLTLIGCGPAFKANKGKAGPASVLSKVGGTATSDTQPKKTPEQLLKETQERLDRESAIEKSGKEGAFVKTNDIANLYISGVKAAREGEELVFSALVKESSEDNKGSVEIRAKIPVSADDVATQVAAENVNLQTIKGAKTTVEPKAEEYSLTSTCQAGCQKVVIHLQRKNDVVAYGAEFIFEITGEDKAVGTLLGSSLQADALVTNFDKALIDAGVEVETAGSEVTGSETTGGAAADAAAKPADEATPADADKKEDAAAAEAGDAAEDKAAADAAGAAIAAGDAETKKSESAEDVAEMTVVESKGTAESAVAAARSTAAPATSKAQERAKIARDIAVKKAQIDRAILENKTALNAMNAQRSNMWKAKEDLTKAQLEFARIDKGLKNFFTTSVGAKKKARELIAAKNKAFNAQVAELKKKISALEASTKVVKALGVEMKALGAQLAALK
jgi:hypothetical protein